MSDEILVKVENVSKKFCRTLKRSLLYGVQDVAGEMMGRQDERDELRPEEFWAVDGVSFELRRGECMGLIGRNGAGKTTLLRMLNGLIKPDKGHIEMSGRVGALIALGAGFNPILTGRENVYVNASVLGLSKKETDGKLEEIIDFAEIEEFIDSPVQTYSSGMQVRLGFAIATALEPDVLLLDEVLAVGDAAFRAKCYNRIGKIQQNAAVIFVSHTMQQIAQISSNVLCLNKGAVAWLGDVKGGINVYNNENRDGEDVGEKLFLVNSPVVSAKIQFSPPRVSYSGTLVADYEITLEKDMPNSSIRIPIYNTEGRVVADWSSKTADVTFDLKKGVNRGAIEIGPIHLVSGFYDLGFVLNDSTGVFMALWSLKQSRIEISEGIVSDSIYHLPTKKVSS